MNGQRYIQDLMQRIMNKYGLIRSWIDYKVSNPDYPNEDEDEGDYIEPDYYRE